MDKNASAACLTSAWEDRSATIMVASLPDSFRSCSFKRLPFSGFLAINIISAPILLSSFADSSPIPFVAPVIKQTLFSRFSFIVIAFNSSTY